MIPVKAILIDDEQLALDYLERQINKICDITIVEKFTHFQTSKHIDLIEEIDIVFLDIEMPGINGLELAEMLLEMKPSLQIVFVTAFHNYAVQAFEVHALDYILKPVQLNRLEKTIERIKRDMSQKSPKQDILQTDKLRINLCNELSLQTPENALKVIRWRTTKAQELFLYLLHHFGKTIRKCELIDILWPGVDHEKAYAQLYTAIYHIRKTISPFTGYLTIKNTSEGYILILRNVFIDVLEWENWIVNAAMIDKENLEDYESYMDLYTGAYLKAYDYIWAEAERYRLEQLWIASAYELANFYYEQGDYKKAEAWYIKIFTMRGEEEETHFSLMKLYAEQGQEANVLHQYGLLIEAVKELNIHIDPKIKRWFDNWQQKRIGNEAMNNKN